MKKKAKKAKGAKKSAAILPAPNATRAGELARAKAEAAAAKKPKGEAKGAQLGKRAQADADAAAGKLPAAPDFSAETHARYRPKLDEVRKLIREKDVKALKAYPINPISTSPKALDRFRNLAVAALEAQAAA